jgi:hypothetical protein
LTDCNQKEFEFQGLKSREGGNDTIDRYPLGSIGAVRILCLTSKVWSQIYKTFEGFRRLFKEPLLRKTSAQNLRLKPKRISKNDPCPIAYEPTRALSLNDADWRRWVRVKEWFNEYPSESDGAEKARKVKILCV